VFHKPGDTITDNSSPNQVKLPYGTDLTNLKTNLTNIGTSLTNLEGRLTTLENGLGSKNLITFRQSIIDHTSINSPFNTLKETIINNQKYSTTMKTVVGEDIYPKLHTHYLLSTTLHTLKLNSFKLLTLSVNH
jgi:hypothetical protein